LSELHSKILGLLRERIQGLTERKLKQEKIREKQRKSSPFKWDGSRNSAVSPKTSSFIGFCGYRVAQSRKTGLCIIDILKHGYASTPPETDGREPPLLRTLSRN
jgi:hypothetical protein